MCLNSNQGSASGITTPDAETINVSFTGTDFNASLTRNQVAFNALLCFSGKSGK